MAIGVMIAIGSGSFSPGGADIPVVPPPNPDPDPDGGMAGAFLGTQFSSDFSRFLAAPS